jgi:signal peptidase I
MAAKKTGGARDTFRTVFYAVLIALVIRTFAYEPFNIPSGSMLPTLLIGDYLFVSKFSYGYSRYSLPFGPPLFSGRVLEGTPERGDVAVFRKPTGEHEDYIKRIIGLPGDKIQTIGGILYINDVAVERRQVDDFVDANGARYIQYIETLPNGVEHSILEQRGDNGGLDNAGPFLVPEGHYFAMGDNRDNSTDSRVLNAVGYIPAENLVGRAEFIFLSADKTAEWLLPWTWFTSIRYERLFEAVR